MLRHARSNLSIDAAQQKRGTYTSHKMASPRNFSAMRFSFPFCRCCPSRSGGGGRGCDTETVKEVHGMVATSTLDAVGTLAPSAQRIAES